MKENKDTPDQNKERLRQQELKGIQTGNLNDAFNRTNNSSLVDLVNSLGWKGTGILILVLFFR